MVNQGSLPVAIKSLGDLATSFPGSFISPPQRGRERPGSGWSRPTWFRLVTCLPKVAGDKKTTCTTNSTIHLHIFKTILMKLLKNVAASQRKIIFMGDNNLNLLRFHSCKNAQNCVLSLQSFNPMPTIDKPTRVFYLYSLSDNIFFK